MTDNVTPINGQFRFAEEEKVYWPAKVMQFGDKPEDDAEVQIQWLVTLLKRDTHERLKQLDQRHRALLKLAQQGQDVNQEMARLSDEMAQVVVENVHGWRGIVGEDGTDIEYNKQNKKLLLDNYRLFTSALGALYAASLGATRKNSKAGAGG